MRKFWKWVGIAVMVVCLAVLCVAGVVHLYLLRQGKRVSIASGGRQVIALGAPLRSEPIPFAEAFTLNKNKYGEAVREPKYIRDGVFVSEKDGVVTARDEAGRQGEYSWQEMAGYICVSQKEMGVNAQWPKAVGEISRLRYIFYGEGGRGALGEAGLAQLRQDASGGEMMKLFLTSETGDENGRITLVGAVLFSQKGCMGGGE